MSGLSVTEYMKRLDQLASKSLTAPEVLASSNRRQPLRSLTDNQRTTEKSSAKDLGMVKQPSQPQQAFASMSSLLAARDTRTEGRSQDESRHSDEEEAPAFRQRSVWSDTNPELADFWTLKRANPIVDENDQDEFPNYQSPTKKSRVQTLAWSDSVDTSEGSLCLEELCRGL